MSSTRRAATGAPFSQERFASSEFEPGLLANLVAMRCAALADPAHAEIIFFIQHLSHQPGGLTKVAADLLAAFPGMVGPTMKELGADEAARSLENVLMELCLDPQRQTVPLSA